jgi:hypothetical protein
VPWNRWLKWTSFASHLDIDSSQRGALFGALVLHSRRGTSLTPILVLGLEARLSSSHKASRRAPAVPRTSSYQRKPSHQLHIDRAGTLNLIGFRMLEAIRLSETTNERVVSSCLPHNSTLLALSHCPGWRRGKATAPDIGSAAGFPRERPLARLQARNTRGQQGAISSGFSFYVKM